MKNSFEKSNLSISIAMATYNGEAYLREQLDSFLNQTLLPDEVVICDDDSTDETIGILQAFKQKAPFEVKIYQNDKNLGYTKNFEKALLNTTRDLVFMSDQDDVWFPKKIERIVQLGKQNHNNEVFVHDTEITNHKLVPVGFTKMDQIERIDRSYESLTMGTCTIVRQRFLKRCLPIPNEYVGHDTWIHHVAKYLKIKKMVIRESLQYYRIHDSNTSSFIVNSINQVSWYNVYKESLQSTPVIKENLSAGLKQNKILCDWLMSNAKNIVSEADLKKLRNRNRVLEQRRQLYEFNRFDRIVPALKFYLNGNYKNFQGIKSLFKDLIL